MQVISFMAIKGGVGKTTMAFQFAKYLQENNKSTLLIDLDSQKSLTGTFETKILKTNTIFQKFSAIPKLESSLLQLKKTLM